MPVDRDHHGDLAVPGATGSGGCGGMKAVAVPADLLEHSGEREWHARAHLDWLHAQIAELSAQVSDAQRLVERLQVTRQNQLKVAGQETGRDGGPGR